MAGAILIHLTSSYLRAITFNMSSEMLPPYSRTDNRYQHVFVRAIVEANHTDDQQNAGHDLEIQDNVPVSMHEDILALNTREPSSFDYLSEFLGKFWFKASYEGTINLNVDALEENGMPVLPSFP